MRRGLTAAAVVAMAICATAQADTIRVRSTTDTVDAGLVGTAEQSGFGLLKAYKDAHPEDTVSYIAEGTGKALQSARNGLADVVITHAPVLEAQFVADGFSVGLGRQIFYSDYVIVGPKSDPASASTLHPHDAIGAFEDIATAGATGNVSFLSRADASGTNVQEQLMWAMTGATVPKQTAPNAAGDTTRQEPTNTAWYRKATGAVGQAENVSRADVCKTDDYPQGNCYTMTDRGTFNRLVNAGTVTKLKIVADRNTPSARGGENLLINPFSAYIVNPDKITSDPKPNTVAAKRFVDFLVTQGFQDALKTFPSAVDPAFLPDALVGLTLDGQPPATVDAGSTVTFKGTVANRLPGGGPVSGQPVQLEESTDGGKTWLTNADGAVSGSDGRFTTQAIVRRQTQYRLGFAAHAASAYNQFTESTQDIGVIGVTSAQSPSPSPTVTPTVTPGPTDRSKPAITGLVLRRKTLQLRVSEAAAVKIVVRQKGKKLFTLSRPKARAGKLTLKHRKLVPGSYKLVVTATDAAGNVGKRTKTLARK